MTLSRRAWLQSVFGASLAGSILASCEKPEARSVTGALLGQSFAAGHTLRGDMRARLVECEALPAKPIGTLIVGSGPAGLSAGYALARADYHDYEILELEPEAGGTSLGGISKVTRYPWAAHYLPVPGKHQRDLLALLGEMGVVSGEDDQGELRISEPHLVRKPDERVFYRGFWYSGLYLRAGASRKDLEELSRFEKLVARWVSYRDAQGRRAFTIPVSQCSDDAELIALDRIPATELLRREGLSSARLRWMLDYACRDDYGLRLEQTSAWALLFYFAARIGEAGEEPADFITWPEGNHALVRHLARASQGRVSSHQLVLDIAEATEGVHVCVWNVRENRPAHYLAQRVIVATPRFITRHIVRALRDAPASASGFTYAPWLVANLHLRDRPLGRGAPPAWDNVLYDSPALGYVCATHQRGSDFGPTVWTYYLPLADQDPAHGREKLLAADWASWRDAILGDLQRAHPDLQEHVEALDVFRWGHAMIRPVTGFVWSTERQGARAPLGAIHFAHTDLSGVALFEEAFDHGLRAAREVLAVIRPGALR